MGLKKCIDCGMEISENASTCIHCGCDYAKLEREQIKKEKQEQEHNPLGNFWLYLILFVLGGTTLAQGFGETFAGWYFFVSFALLLYIYREELFFNGCGIKNNEPSTPY